MTIEEGLRPDPVPVLEPSAEFPPDDAGRSRRIYFHGASRPLLEIQAANVFLILITLGIYYFWAKARVRSYLLSQTEFEGDRFAYHGTGKEQLIGFIKAGLLFGGLSLFFKSVPFWLHGAPMQVAFSVIGYLAFLSLLAVARVGARRYRLSRISWRNIRFSFRGEMAAFLRIYLIGFLLNIVTLGFYYPFFQYKQSLFMISHSYFGNRNFSFDGKAKELYKIYSWAALGFIAYLFILFLLMAFLSIFAAGINQFFSSKVAGLFISIGMFLILAGSFSIPWSFLVTEQQQYFWNHLSFGGARFRLEVTFPAYLRLKMGNAILFVLTLGLAWPWMTIRNMRFLIDHLTLEGPLDLEAIRQEAQAPSPFGDEFDAFLDLDLGPGIG